MHKFGVKMAINYILRAFEVQTAQLGIQTHNITSCQIKLNVNWDIKASYNLLSVCNVVHVFILP